jgi:hypothetical protein
MLKEREIKKRSFLGYSLFSIDDDAGVVHFN